jgi:hypothetical protein
MTKKATAATEGKSALDATVEAYLIEHGGAPLLTTTHGKGKSLSSVTSPQFPDPLPTLAEAMRQFPCGHPVKLESRSGNEAWQATEREKAVCCVAPRTLKGAQHHEEKGLVGPRCGRRRCQFCDPPKKKGISVAR